MKPSAWRNCQAKASHAVVSALGPPLYHTRLWAALALLAEVVMKIEKRSKRKEKEEEKKE